MGYFVKFKLYRTTEDQEPYKIQKYEIENECFDSLQFLLPKDEGPYMVRYVDSEGDLCTIDDDLTFRAALKSVTNNQNRKTIPFRDFDNDNFSLRVEKHPKFLALLLQLAKHNWDIFGVEPLLRVRCLCLETVLLSADDS